jgi:peptide/nickel transport system permease protein
LFEIIVKRCLTAIPLLVLLTLLTFALLRALPGDPIDVLMGSAEKDLTSEQKQAMRKELGLDKSWPQQYVCWLKAIAQGNFGRSYRDGRPVLELIEERLPATLNLVGAALLLTIIVGTLWGLLMVCLSVRNSSFANLLMALAYALYSTPSFWLAFLLIALVERLNIPNVQLLGLHAPGQSGINFASLWLPATVLASRRAAKLSLLLCSSMLSEMSKDYVVTARMKGLSKLATLAKHVSKNSLVPAINLIGLSIPVLIGGSVLVETVFAWPGMGRLAVDATFGRNYPVLLSLAVIYGTLVIIANLAADLAQLIIDPRIKDQNNVVANLGHG